MYQSSIHTVIHTVFGAALSVLLSTSPLMKPRIWYEIISPITAFIVVLLVGVFGELAAGRIRDRQPHSRAYLFIVALAALSMPLVWSDMVRFDAEGLLMLKLNSDVALLSGLMIVWCVSLVLTAYLGRVLNVRW
jgi:hypothetical protein